MLALLQPWRQLEMLKAPTRSWEEEFSAFVEGGSQRVVDVLAGIQYYYDSKEKAIKRNVDLDIEEDQVDLVDERDDGGGDIGDERDDIGDESNETVCFIVV